MPPLRPWIGRSFSGVHPSVPSIPSAFFAGETTGTTEQVFRGICSCTYFPESIWFWVRTALLESFRREGLRHWKDGRDVPDVVMSLLDYSASDSHPAFNMALQVNFADGSGGGTLFRFVGDEGVMTIGSNEVKVTRLGPRSEPGYTVGTFTEDQQEAFMEQYRRDYPEPKRAFLIPSSEKLYRTPRDYNSRLDHLHELLQSNARRRSG